MMDLMFSQVKQELGKTLIVDSLEIIMGGRFSKEMIKAGTKQSFVELSLYINDENIIVTREISIEGRNLSKINGRLVTVAELKQYMIKIIDLHGQNDNQSLLNVNLHIKLLDDFALINKNEYIEKYSEYLNIKKDLKNNYGDPIEKARQLDLLKYQLNEIETANIKLDEEEKLNLEKKRLLNSEKISSSINNAKNEINSKILEGLQASIKELEKINEIDEIYKENLQVLQTSYYDIEEVLSDLSHKDLNFDKEMQEEIEERLNLIFSLKRKYGNIFEYKEKIKEQINVIENLEEYIDKLNLDLEKLEKEMQKMCDEMHIKRVVAAKTLQDKINKELNDLEMKNAVIGIQIIELEKFGEIGKDEVEILISTNLGEGLKPLNKIASGGEMARVMLAIKTVLTDVDKTPVLVFDEIDTGISGVAANAVAKKLRTISKKHQVLCVTHLAVIAAKGEHNYYVEKHIENNKTSTRVTKLDEEGLLKEIARISSGNVTEIAIKHAKELRGKCI